MILLADQRSIGLNGMDAPRGTHPPDREPITEVKAIEGAASSAVIEAGMGTEADTGTEMEGAAVEVDLAEEIGLVD